MAINTGTTITDSINVIDSTDTSANTKISTNIGFCISNYMDANISIGCDIIINNKLLSM